ncbi:Transposase [Chryseolinea serpens]|uniref:Transposase n=2 Tax=Chryseolinea serpens TaxID=947013 RepID=A0A1M5MLT8_9BACT|nr:Transposase [Chryseolinea serpens]
MRPKLVQNFVGIDVSKKWFNVYIVQKVASRHTHFQCANTPEGIIELNKHLKSSRVSLSKLTIVTIEHTGPYSKLLINFFSTHGVLLCVEMGVRIKRSLGTAKGKSDDIDAKRITEYSIRHLDKLILHERKPRSLETVKTLLKNRSRLLKAKAIVETPFKELQNFSFETENKFFHSINGRFYKSVDEACDRIMSEIKRILNEDERMKNQVHLLIGIPGIGLHTALALVCYTNYFTTCSNSGQLASYCGCAPFSYSSGLKAPQSHIHKMSNKVLKGHLHLAALALINSSNELKDYYERKVSEGKPKRLALNNVGHKLVLRAMAVIKRNSRYVPVEVLRKRVDMLQLTGMS